MRLDKYLTGTPVLVYIITGIPSLADTGLHIFLYEPEIRVALDRSGRLSVTTRQSSFPGKHGTAVGIYQPTLDRNL